MEAHEWYKTGRIELVNDLEVFYKREGTGTPLLCIHGFPSSSWDFEALWPALTSQFDVVASDLVGLGKSAKPKQPITIRLQADVLEDLLVQQNITEGHLFAHDLGDTVAQELLARQLEGSGKIKWLSCTLLNGGIFPETHRPLLIQRLLISPLGNWISPLTTKRSFSKNMTRVFSPNHPPSKEFIDETWHLITHDQGKKMIPKLIRYMKERSDHRERWVTPLTAQVVPLVLINGVLDPISGEHAAARFEEIIPNARVIRLPNSGHYPHLETPDEVVTAFMSFHQRLKR